MRPHVGWRAWTHIVPGMFGGYGLTDLLLFEASTGTAEFYAVTSDAKIEFLNRHTGWPTGLQVVPGYFGESGKTDLLLYDPATGVGEFYEVSEGRLEPLNAHTGWRETWNVIVPGDFTHFIQQGTGYSLDLRVLVSLIEPLVSVSSTPRSRAG